MGQNPDGLTTHWARIAGSWLPYWEGAVRNIANGSPLGQRDRCMLDLCQAMLELDDRLSKIEREAGKISQHKDEIDQLKEGLRKVRDIANRFAAKL